MTNNLTTILREVWTSDTLAACVNATPDEALTIHAEPGNPVYVIAHRKSDYLTGRHHFASIDVAYATATSERPFLETVNKNIRQATIAVITALRSAPTDLVPETDAATYLLA